MMIVDYILLVVLAYSTLWGFKKGIIKSVGGMIGLVGAVLIASRNFEKVAYKIAPVLGFQNNMNLARMLSFVALLLVVSYSVSFVVSILEKTYSSVAVLPFMKLGNRVLGAILGLVQSSVMVGLILYFVARFPFGSVVESFFQGSRVAPIMLNIAGIIQPLLPDAIKQVESLI